MARFKPDLAVHIRAAGVKKSIVIFIVEAGRLIRSGWRPETVWMRSSDYDVCIAALRGAGFDVARGVVLEGIKVGRYEE